MLEQEVWLERQLIKSTTPFNIVYTHFAPYSCGSHGNHEKTQFNYYGLGVDMFFQGTIIFTAGYKKPGRTGFIISSPDVAERTCTPAMLIRFRKTCFHHIAIIVTMAP
jgi:hypothetical protein